MDDASRKRSGDADVAGAAKRFAAATSPIELTYSQAGQVTTKAFDLLVIACDPQLLAKNNIMTMTADEQNVFSPEHMKAVTFQTTLFKFDVPSASDQIDPKTLPAVRFAPEPLARLDGSIYGYRSETRKQWKGIPDSASYELVTVYQLLDPSLHGEMTEHEMVSKRDAQLQDGSCPWVPYSNGEVIQQFHTKYFSSFTLDAIKSGNADMWKYLDLQGANRTIYVHASTAFESVLHCYQYIELLMKDKQSIFPQNKDCRIAVIGAGPSGLLASRKLRKMEYNNIQVFEVKKNETIQSGPNAAMLAGKTQTHPIDQKDMPPAPDNASLVPCELGTCYLSPAYDDMVAELSDIFVDNTRISFDTDYKPANANFREIACAGQFRDDGPAKRLHKLGALAENGFPSSKPFPTVLGSDFYPTLKGFEESSHNGTDAQILAEWSNIEETILVAVLKYILNHKLIFNDDVPFSDNRPWFWTKSLKKNIYDWLRENDLEAMIGTLQYAYSVQGYGSTEPGTTTCAFYLLVWITPPSLIASLSNEIKAKLKGYFEDTSSSSAVAAFLAKKAAKLSFIKNLLTPEGIVTAWSKGWGDAWRQQKELFDVDRKAHGTGVSINYEVDITTIRRSGV